MRAHVCVCVCVETQREREREREKEREIHLFPYVCTILYMSINVRVSICDFCLFIFSSKNFVFCDSIK